MSAPTGAHELRPTLPLETTPETFGWYQLHIPLDKIDERTGFNPRTDYGDGDGSFASLVESIRQRGMLELPRLMPVVDKRGDWDPVECRFTIVAGHRRIAAARALGWESVCVFVPDAEGKQLATYDDGQQLVDALVENLQRKELNCIEVAEGIARLEKLGKTQADIARWIGRDQGRVSKTVRLLELPAGVRALLRDGGLSASHGEELLPLLGESFLPGEIETLAHSAVETGLTKSGLRNVVQDKIKRSQPVQASIDDYAPAHNSEPEDEMDARIARTLASTKGLDKEPKPAPKETNGLSRKDSDIQFAAAMAPDPDVAPLVDRVQAASATLSPEVQQRVRLGEWLNEIGLSWIDAADKLRDITGPGGDAHKPGLWLRLEPDTALKLMELCDWHLQEHKEELTAGQMLNMVVEVYHSLKLERRVEAQAATDALGAGSPDFERLA